MSRVSGRPVGLRSAVLLAAVALFAGVLPLAPGMAAPAAAADPPPLTAAQKALAKAASSGEQVEVVGERSEYSTVYANPDGKTFTLRESAAPVRVATGDGGWQKPDPTLVQHADGSIGPKAAVVDMQFSSGDDDSLAEISRNGRSLSLGWPTDLPAPVLDGNTATYPDVLPDVDLKVTASAEGFRHVLVVKTPEAAAQDALKQLDFSLETHGLTVEETNSGGLTAQDANGNDVFTAPVAHMWDSAGEDAPKSLAVQSAPATTTGGAGDEDDKDGPGPGDTVSGMDLTVSSSTLAITPDSDMLADTPADDFPIYIDPHISWGESERTLLRSDGYEDWAWTGTEGVGECGSWGGYSCGPGYRQRLYFEFSPSKLRGKKVLDATFRVTETWSFTCDPTWLQLWRTGNISSSSNWPGPSKINMMGDRWVSAGRGSACDPSQPDAPIEFNDNPNESNENLTPTVRNFAQGEFSRFTLMLRSKDETTTKGWKRFKHDAELDVKYVGKPARPTGVGLVTGNGAVCEHDASDPQVSTDPSPRLTSTVQTESGGESEADLRAYFDIDVQNSDGSWSDSPADNGSLRPSTGYAGDGTKQVMSWPTLDEGPLYRYRTWVLSYYGDGKYLAGSSNATGDGWCYFTVDATAPKAPSLTLAEPYQQCLPNDCPAEGGPGTTATVTGQPDAGDDVTAMQYRVSTSDNWQDMSASGSGYTAEVTPSRAGTVRVSVRAEDAEGRWGATSVIDFLVKAGEGPIARWHFDEASGDAVDAATSADSAQQNAHLVGGATRDDRGRRGVVTHDAQDNPLDQPITDRGLVLGGAEAGAHTDGPVIETRSAYTVSAWVRLEKKRYDYVVLSQDGQNSSNFVLAYINSVDTWYFGVRSADDLTNGTIQGFAAGQPAQVGVWTHVAGTYDPGTGELSLYVNGVLQGTRTISSSWAATGDFQIGRLLREDSHLGSFDGSIDEVAVWQRILTPQEIADEARLKVSDTHNAVELVASWQPTTSTGDTLSDTTSGYGQDLTLEGGATVDGGTIVLDGVDDSATASSALIDDTGSFTVTTAVDLDEEAIAGKPIGYIGQVAGQRTSSGSSWGIWYELTDKQTTLDPETGEEKTVPVGFWHFGRLKSDGTFDSITSNEAAAVNGIVRLTGVFDAQSATISLYLSSVQNGTDQEFTAKSGTGDFAIGMGFSDGTWGNFLPARISDVRLWTGAVASWTQLHEVVGD